MSTRHLTMLAYPNTYGMSPGMCAALADELTVVAGALREQVAIWRAADCRGLEATVVAVADLAEQIAARAHTYRAGPR